MLHWRLLSTLGRALLVAAAVGLIALVVLGVSGTFSSVLTFATIVVVLAAAFVRRRDLNLAISDQLQREADEEEERRQHDQ